VSGRIELNGRDLRACSEEELREVRGREIAMVFQDPMTSLNPVLTIGHQVSEVLRMHSGERRSRVVFEELTGAHRLRRRARGVLDTTVELLAKVGIPAARTRVGSYPHEFSGGMRQRVLIGASLALRPALLIADEPTTALDVTIQAQVLALLRDVRRELGASLLLITHDLGVVAENCSRVYVMYAGQIVEEAPTRELFDNPRHPYTAGLIAAIPDLDVEREWLATIEGSLPDPTQPVSGCRFFDRCPLRRDPRCRTETPALREVARGHRVACFYDLGDGASGAGIAK
jgi:oligopeptide/dipeptide ABC transporter ATP-binding protein